LDVKRSAFASLRHLPTLSNPLSTLSRYRLNLLPLVRSELEFRRRHVLLQMRER